MANNKAFIAKNGLGLGDGYDMPETRPSLMFDFKNGQALDPLITYGRGSTGTYMSKETARGDENLFTNSQVASAWATSNTTTTNNDATAPDGTTTAFSVTGSAGTASKSIYRSYNNYNTSLAEFTYSIFAKAGTHSIVQIASNLSGFGQVNVDLSDGSSNTIGNASVRVDDYQNGWYRIIVNTTYVYTPGGSMRIYLVDSKSSTEGAATSSTGTLYLWGVQMEQRSSANVYCPTTSSVVREVQPLIKTASANVPRFEHDSADGECKGFLVEQQRTNIIYPSLPSSGSGQMSTNLHTLTNAALAPDGTMTATVLMERTTSTQQVSYYNSGTASTGVYFSWSLYVKPLTTTSFILTMYGETSASFTLTGAGTASSDGRIEYVGNGWYRCTMIKNKTASASANWYLGFSTSTYSGEGYKRAVAVWGAQVEQARNPTSYIATTVSGVTRSADLSQITNIDDADWFNSYEGTVVATVDVSEYLANYYVFSISDGTGNNRLDHYISGDSPTVYVATGGTAQANFSLGTISYEDNGPTTIAYSYENNNLTMYAGNAVDGTANTTDTSVLIPRTSELNIGCSADTSVTSPICGHIQKFTYYPVVLSDTIKQELVEV